MDSILLLLGLLSLCTMLLTITALPSECLLVHSVAEDVSASKLVFFKNNTEVDGLCPGTTYGISLTFPQARNYQLISTKGAFQDPEASCANRVTRTTASATGHEKLYLGCPATGAVKVTMLSSSASVPQLMKAVTWQIKPLSECPSSPCNNQPAAASTSSPASSTSPDNGNTVIQLTGNPLADLNMVYQLFTASASPFKIPTTLDPATAFELMTIVTEIQETPMTAATTVAALQKLLNLMPGSSDPMGLVAGMKTFLNVMAPYVSATATASAGLAGTGGAGALNMLSSLASLAGGNPATAAGMTAGAPNAASLLSLISSLSSLATGGLAGGLPSGLAAGLTAPTTAAGTTPSSTEGAAASTTEDAAASPTEGTVDDSSE